MEELVGDVAAIADELGWQRFDLVGHDWRAGGMVGGAPAARVRTLRRLVPHPAAFAHARATDEDQHDGPLHQSSAAGRRRRRCWRQRDKLRRIYD